MNAIEEYNILLCNIGSKLLSKDKLSNALTTYITTFSYESIVSNRKH